MNVTTDLLIRVLKGSIHMTIHLKKLERQVFGDIAEEIQTFVLKSSTEGNYKKGDLLIFCETGENGEFLNRILVKEVSHITKEVPGLKKNWEIVSFHRIKNCRIADFIEINRRVKEMFKT